MNPKVQEVMESAMQATQQQISTLEPVVDAKMGSLLDVCFNRNSSNAERFAECILEKNKKME